METKKNYKGKLMRLLKALTLHTPHWRFSMPESKLKEANDILTKIKDCLTGEIEMDKDVIAHYNDLHKLIIEEIELWKLNQ